MRRLALACRLGQPVHLVGNVGIAGIEIFHADEPAQPHCRQKLAVGFVGIDDAAAPIGDDARVGHGIDQPVEEHALARQPADMHEAGDHP